MVTSSDHTLIQPTVMPNSFCLDALTYIAHHFNITIETKQLAHQLGKVDDEITARDLCRCAKWIGLRAKEVSTTPQRLNFVPTPALIKTKLGWLVLKSASQSEATIYDPKKGTSRRYSIEVLAKYWSGETIFISESKDDVREHRFGLQWFIPSVTKHFCQFKYILSISLAMQIIALVTPMLFENVIDRVLVSRSLTSLEVLGFAMLILAIFEPIYGYMRSWLFANLASKVNSELSSRLYQHLISLPLNYFQQRQTGQIIARVKEMGQIRQFLIGSALTMVLDLVFVFIFIGVMFNYATKLTWIVVGSLVIYFIFWLIVGPSLRRRVLREYELAADNTAFLAESVTGIETIKTTATEDKFIHKWQRLLSSFTRASFKSKVVGIWAGQGIGLIQKITSAIVLWFGVSLVMEGSLTAGGLIAFNMLSGHVTQPILRLAQVWQDFQHTLISLRRVGDILNEESEKGTSGLASIPTLRGQVQFSNVRFRYSEDTKEVLNNISLNIKPGEFVGITGPSGSGKSTLTRLLQRLYIPQHGQVLVDGLDLAIADPIALRRNMSIVLQESILFSGTVAENISLCRPSANLDEIISVAKIAGVDDFVQTMPEGYASQVGEKGNRLSGGQRQRIALARALLSNPRVLILDEATSALDYESEASIMSNMANISSNRTVISIAHRLNTIRHADRILVIDQGQIIEQGTHEQLLKKTGLYAELWKSQSRS